MSKKKEEVKEETKKVEVGGVYPISKDLDDLGKKLMLIGELWTDAHNEFWDALKKQHPEFAGYKITYMMQISSVVLVADLDDDVAIDNLA